MKLWKIFRFEFTYQFTRIATWLYLAVLFAFPFIMNGLTTPGDGVYANNTFNIIGFTVIGGLIWLMMSASIAGEAGARDVQAKMHPLIYTTPITTRDYLAGKFLAAYAVNALLLLSLPLGVLLSLYLPGIEHDKMGPFRLWPYLNVYLFILLPMALIATALQFCFAALSRKVMLSYLATLLLALIAQVIAVTVAKLLGNWDLVKLLDPVGVSGIIGSELATWTVTEKNTRLLTMEGMFLWNRFLWLSVAIGSLLFTYRRFSFTQTLTNSFWNRFKRSSKVQYGTSEATIIRSTAINVPQVHRNFGVTTFFHQTLRIAYSSFGKIARNPIGLTLVGATSIISVVFGERIISEFGIPLITTTSLIVSYLAPPLGVLGSPWVVIPLLIMYFVGELVWRERDAGLSDIADVAPVTEWVLLTGKFLGLSFIILVWMGILMAGGIAMQLAAGYDTIEIGLYLKVLFGIQFTNYLLFALLTLVVHIVVNQKYIAYLVIILIFSFIAFPSIYRVEHTMLIFAKDAGWWHTDMRGFGSTLGPWFWFKSYWVAWALLLAVVAKLLWPRGRGQSLKSRLHIAPSRFTRSTAWVTIVGAGFVLTLGSFIFYNTNILNEYQSGSDISKLKAKYERRYGKYRNTLQPQHTATKLRVEIYPDRQQVDIDATYTLVNKDSVAIDTIHIGSVSGIEPDDVKFSQSYSVVVIDKQLSHHIYALKQPLRPGDSLQLTFAIHFKQRGFLHNGTNELVMENGTNFTNYNLLPNIGYQRARELDDAVLRKKYLLASRPEVPSLYDREALKKPLSTDQMTFEATIGTVRNEIAVAPGVLQKMWIEKGRRYFHYKTNGSIGSEYCILSGNYAIRESRWNDVAVRIYYHSGHAKNIDRMLRSVNASLEYYTTQFGPYPYPNITVVERAGNGSGASADAGIIYYGEQYSLLNPDDSPTGFDLPYYILAHEIGHQWWGVASLTPANVEGAGVLIEGLSVYSGMQVLEKTYGDGHLQQYVNYLHSSYAMPRSLASASLLQANESFLYYRKGGIAMYALSKYLGKEKVNNALRELLRKRTSGELPLPTTLNLYREIKQITPDSLDYLLDDLFRKNTYWRLKTEQFTAAPTKAGQWAVTLKVRAQKMVVDSAGKESDIPMNDWLEVGVYEGGEKGTKPLYLRMHRIHSGSQIIKLIVPRKPQSGGIDPNSLMIDLRQDDNIKTSG